MLIPEDFINPISHDLLIQPVRTNCFGYNRWSIVNWLKGYPPFQGHIFEKIYLSSWFTKSHNHLCPVCGREITKIAPDTELAQRIRNEFVYLNHRNGDHFQNLKRAMLTANPILFNESVNALNDREFGDNNYYLNAKESSLDFAENAYSDSYGDIAVQYLLGLDFRNSFRVFCKISPLKKISFFLIKLPVLIVFGPIIGFVLYILYKLKYFQ
ncbi:MAG: hypothetical protein WCT85_04030 [Parachlamydiales bacterium]|jgi:hypothetical protein